MRAFRGVKISIKFAEQHLERWSRRDISGMEIKSFRSYRNGPSMASPRMTFKDEEPTQILLDAEL